MRKGEKRDYSKGDNLGTLGNRLVCGYTFAAFPSPSVCVTANIVFGVSTNTRHNRCGARPKSSVRKESH